MLVGIIGAMDIEVEGLKAVMENVTTETFGLNTFHKGTLNGVDCVVAVAGIGKVNAAVCAQTMILEYKPDMIINSGVAGGLINKFKIGDIAIATQTVEHDMDTSPIGEPYGFISGLDKVYMDADENVSDMLYKAASKLDGIHIEKGIIASGDQFISTDEQRKRITENFNAIAAEMEGGSIGHVCSMSKIPFGVLRAISDGANEDSHMDYPTFAKMAAENSIKIMINFMEEVK